MMNNFQSLSYLSLICSIKTYLASTQERTLADSEISSLIKILANLYISITKYYPSIHTYRFHTQGINHYIVLARVIRNGHIIVLQQLQPPVLSKIQILLIEYFLKVVMISENRTVKSTQTASLQLQSKICHCQL